MLAKDDFTRAQVKPTQYRDAKENRDERNRGLESRVELFLLRKLTYLSCNFRKLVCSTDSLKRNEAALYKT